MATRRSSRRIMSTGIQPLLANTDTNYVPDTEAENENVERKPYRKRIKQNTNSNNKGDQKVKYTRGRRGALKGIVEMPLDILYEIFLYLYPADILRLSRMNKMLRRVLMTKSVDFIWQKARLNLGDLPVRPDDLNEPQYARLIFDPLCDYCMKHNATSIIWSNRRRCCKRCLRDESLMAHWCGTPTWKYGEIAEIIPSIDLRTGQEHTFRPDRTNFFCLLSLAQLQDKYQKLEGVAKAVWLTKQEQERRQRIAHGRLCESWIAKQAEKRACDLDEVRTRRYHAIRQKLIELGWEEELRAFGYSLHQLPSVKQSKDLTDRIWNNIKDDLINALETHKVERLEREHKSAQQDRLNRLAALCKTFYYSEEPQNRIIAPFADLVAMEPFQTLVNAPTAEHITFTDALLREGTQSWRRSKEGELLGMMVSSSPSPNGVETLSLATTVFQCRRCGDQNVIGYPEVLMHRCASADLYSDYTPSLYSIHWNYGGKHMLFHEKAHDSALTILEASGLDPSTITRKDVQRPDFFVECHECCLEDHSGGRRILMTWLSALRHAVSHDTHQQVYMARAELSDDEQKLASKLEVEKLRSTYRGFACMRCTAAGFAGSWETLCWHLKIKHVSERDHVEPIEFLDYTLQGDISGCPVQSGGVLVLELGNT